MYKKILPALLLMASAHVSSAQSILTGANFNPVIGDQFVSVNSDTSGIYPGAAGAGITWDFSTLLDSVSSDTGLAVLPSTTAAGVGFASSTYAVTTGASSIATAYYTATSSKLSQNGIYASLTSGSTYTDPIDVMRYPFTYTNTYTDTYAGTIIFSSVPVATHGSVTVTCDAYGTLKLPHGNTHTNVLRVHTTQQYIDSANLFGTGTIDTFQIETYTWYEPNYHSALMTIATGTSTAGNYKQVSYESKQLAASVPALSGMASLVSLFPNPAHNELNIEYKTTNLQQVNISLTDMLGREVATIATAATQGSQHITYSTVSLPRGTYLVRITSNGETETRKIQLL